MKERHKQSERGNEIKKNMNKESTLKIKDKKELIEECKREKRVSII
jgi:hypothetical protein